MAHCVLIYFEGSRQGEVIYGVTKRISLTTRIHNTGEAAYQPKLMLRFHSDMEVETAEVDQMTLQFESTAIKPDDVTGNNRQLSVYLPSIGANIHQSVVVRFSLVKRKPTRPGPYVWTATAVALDIEKTPQQHNTVRNVLL